MEPIIVAIALLCGPTTCDNVVQEPRFETHQACEEYLSYERLRQSRNGNQIVLDDCIITTEERIKEFQ
jgi:hypothetical protein